VFRIVSVCNVKSFLELVALLFSVFSLQYFVIDVTVSFIRP